MTVDRALLIHEKWISKILHEGKNWELRTTRCARRGRVALAATRKSSSCGVRMLLGEVDIVQCIQVAVVRQIKDARGNTMGLQFFPPPSNPEQFMWLPQNRERHQVSCDVIPWGQSFILVDREGMGLFGQNCTAIFAWILENLEARTKPKQVKSASKNGQVKWIKLEPEK